MALTPSSAPLVWIDCEMTGLNPLTDSILQIYCLITTPDLVPIDAVGLDLIIHHPPSVLSSMPAWCQHHHTATNLIARVTTSLLPPSGAGPLLLAYIKSHIPEKGVGLLAGSSVHMDKEFLRRLCPEVLEYLDYRILDVSAVKECVRRWAPRWVLDGAPLKRGGHEAKMDVEDSLAEVGYYRRVFFGELGDKPLEGWKAKAVGEV